MRMPTHPPTHSVTHFSPILKIDKDIDIIVPEVLNKTIKRVKVVLCVAIGLSILSLIFFILSVLGTANEKVYEKVYAPLGPFPEQTVNSRIPGVEGPAINVGDPLNVTGKKCVSEKVKVTSSFAWVLEKPVVTVFPAGSGQRERPAGCLTTTFNNLMPEDVIKEVWRQASMGVFVTTWVISGTETPISPDGSRGQPLIWTTEEFVIVAQHNS